MSQINQDYYIGVDVGTGSVRASLVRNDGTVIASSSQETNTFRDQDDHRIFEQSTKNIWGGISVVLKELLAESKISASAVKGLGFDATCSLAVSDFSGEPVVITKGDRLGQIGDRNVILWADHRADKEAEIINSTGSVVLDYVGGVMSLEMEIPKILWLKKNMKPHLFSRCQFFDLPDFLTYYATGDGTRSCCSLTCKCSYVPNRGWQADFFQKIGISDLVDDGECKQLGAANGHILTAGLPVGKGLSRRAAGELGLVEGTAVGSGLIDAYAGWMGTVAARYTENGRLSNVIPTLKESSHRLAIVAGTSTCHVAQVCVAQQHMRNYPDAETKSPEGISVPGVWGPYKDVVFRGWWMNEGGQSSTGQLIDFMITSHPACTTLSEKAKQQHSNIYQVLHEVLEKLQVEKNAKTLTELMKDMHLYPDFHGNRSPIADPRMRGSIVGLQLDSGLSDLAKKYYITLEAIALQTRQIVDEMNRKGHKITSIYVSGSQAQNKLMMQLIADTCNMPVVLPHSCSGAVVLGAAMLGRFAATASAHPLTEEKQGEALWNIMVEMTPPGTMITSAAGRSEKKLLEAKYKIFIDSIDIQKRWRQEMEDALK